MITNPERERERQELKTALRGVRVVEACVCWSRRGELSVPENLLTTRSLLTDTGRTVSCQLETLVETEYGG